VEMGEVVGSVEAKERTDRWVLVWRLEKGSLVLRRETVGLWSKDEGRYVGYGLEGDVLGG